MPKISIIMPVYNSEKYLRAAVDSVLKQTFKDFELLLVDDGSTDSCGKICDDYASKDKRIVVFHKQNGGACSARNLAMQNCSADLITFIDNDDLYEERFLEIMIGRMEETGVDYIKCGRRVIKIKEDGEVIYERILSYDSEEALNLDGFVNIYTWLRKEGYLSAVWNGIYRKDIIQKHNLTFREDLKHGQEDVIFNCQYELVSKSFLFIPDLLYVHFIRMGHSTSSKFYPDIIYDHLDATELELKIVAKNKLMYDLVTLKSMRECYAILYPLPKAEKAPYLKAVHERLDCSILKDFPVLRNNYLRKKERFDLFLIKHGMPQLLYLSRKIYKSDELKLEKYI